MKTSDNSISVGKNAMKAVVILAGLAVMTACSPSESEDEAEVPAAAADEASDEGQQDAPPPATDEAGEEGEDATPATGDQSQGRDPTTGAPG